MDSDVLYADGHHGGTTFWEGRELESRDQLLDEQVEIATSPLKMGVGSSMEK